MMSKQDMENINSSDELDHDIISTEMLEDIRDGSHTHPNVNITDHVIKYVTILGQDNRNVKDR